MDFGLQNGAQNGAKTSPKESEACLKKPLGTYLGPRWSQDGSETSFWMLFAPFWMLF